MKISILARRRLYSTTYLDPYASAGFSPKLVFDPVGDTYRTGGSATTFAGMVDYTGASNKTMVDSDGTLKWAPHNLLTWSEDFSNAAWLKSNVTVTANAATAPDGTDTADKVVNTGATGGKLLYQGGVATGRTTVSVFAKAGEFTRLRINEIGGNRFSANFDLSVASATLTSGADGIAARISPVGSGWYLCEIDHSASSAANSIVGYPASAEVTAGNPNYNADGVSGIYLWGAHLYRSDLGGMADNPDTGDSYVPTTSAARYLSRRGHHVYEGGEWVNAGMLVEPTAATNLVTWSNDFTNWTPSNITVTANQEAGHSGLVDLDKITPNTTNTFHFVRRADGAAATDYVLQVVAKSGGYDWLVVGDNLASGAGNQRVAWFNLNTGVRGSKDDNGTGGVKDWNMVSLGGGLYLCWISLTSSNGFFEIGVSNADGVRSFAGNGTSGLFAGYTQGEAGSVPSSYIPTAGSTATRAAETVSIAAAKVPFVNPDNLGPESVTNGTFDTASDWLEISGGSSLTISGGQASFAISAGFRGIYQAKTINIGTPIRVSFDVVSVSGGTVEFIGKTAGDGISGSTVFSVPATAPGSYSAFFPLSGNVASIAVRNSLSGTTTVIDNISVREVTALELSIAMRGRMTYADTNTDNQAVWVDWGTFTTNGLRLRMTTAVGGTGSLQALQASAGVVDQVFGVNSYSPGINVPFSIASRHGSTFINGAVDGTALTADLTPTSLPNLSATNLSLAVTGGPMIIEQFTMFDTDLGDSGISEASS